MFIGNKYFRFISEPFFDLKKILFFWLNYNYILEINKYKEKPEKV